jgi:hypothetical protein
MLTVNSAMRIKQEPLTPTLSPQERGEGEVSSVRLANSSGTFPPPVTAPS